MNVTTVVLTLRVPAVHTSQIRHLWKSVRDDRAGVMSSGDDAQTSTGRNSHP